YNEKVTVGTAGLTIRGAEAGVDARGRNGAESVVQAPGGVTGLFINANDVTIDGFTMQNATNGNNVGAALYIQPGVSGTHIQNNIVQNNIVGIFVSNSSATDPAVISQNLFQNNNQKGPASGNDIYADSDTAGEGIQNIIVQNNSFTNSSFVENHWAVGFGNISTIPFNAVQILNNSVNNSG